MIVGQENTRRHLGKSLPGGTSGIGVSQAVPVAAAMRWPIAPVTATARTTRRPFMGILRRGRHSWPAPHHRPAVSLEILGDVPLAPVATAPLGRRSLTEWEPPTRLCTTVEDHVRGLAGEGMLEIRDA